MVTFLIFFGLKEMASIFGVIGASLRQEARSPGTNQPMGRGGVFTCLLGAVVGVCAVLGTNTLQPASTPGLQSAAQRYSRRSYNKTELVKLAAEATRYRESAGNDERYWRVNFLLQKHGEMPPSILQVRQRELRAALKEFKGAANKKNAEG